MSGRSAAGGNGAVESSRDAGLLRARVHLLAADDLLTERYRGRAYYFTMCGQVITDAQLPHATCEGDECDCEVRYCPDCIDHATRWNAEIDADAAPAGQPSRRAMTDIPDLGGRDAAAG